MSELRHSLILEVVAVLGEGLGIPWQSYRRYIVLLPLTAPRSSHATILPAVSLSIVVRV